MATSTGEVEKINVRSPYYLVVDSENAPAGYTPPATVTQPVGCGEQINVGEDVGTRIYEVDVTDRSGDFRINYTIYSPVKITYQLTEDASPTVVGYRGSAHYEQQLEQLGVSPSELTELVDAEFHNSYIDITRATDSASTLTITVEAPLQTDRYLISLSCPDLTPVPIFTPPVTPPSNFDLLDGSETIAFYLRQATPYDLGFNVFGNIYINGTLVKTRSLSANNLEYFVFSNESLSWGPISSIYGTSPSGQPDTLNPSYLIQGDNLIEIEFSWNDPSFIPMQEIIFEFFFNRTGIFQNTNVSEYQWAWHECQGTYDLFGFDGVFVRDARVAAIASTGGKAFRNGVKRSFNYNTEDQEITESSQENTLGVSTFHQVSGCTDPTP